MVGRDGGVAVELGDLQVSRRHALLVAAREGFFVKDLGSRNGLTLNERRLPPRTQAPLRNGDVLSLGRTTLVFKDLGDEAESGEAAEPTLKLDAPALARGAAPRADGAGKGERADASASEAPRRPAAALSVLPCAHVARGGAASGSPRPDPERGVAPSPSAEASIPRALPPGSAPTYHGHAEVLALRALVERAERDRAYYRNLSLALFVLLALTLLGVLLWALAAERPGAPAPQAPRAGAAIPAVPTEPAPAVPGRPRLDRAAFDRAVHPILAARCAGCHEDPARGGELLLARSNDAATRAANFAAVLPFVRAAAPEQSPLLLAPLPPEEGGLPGACGPVLSVDSAEWQRLRRWVLAGSSGAPGAGALAPANLPPIARVRGPVRGRVGERLLFDGGASSDPEGAALRHRWSVVAAPPSSTARLEGDDTARVRLVPDVPGRYVLALVVRDGAATGSAEHELTVEPAEAGPARAGPPELDGLFLALLGRPPSSEERARFARAAPEELRRFLRERPELTERWWKEELVHFDLRGEHRPRGEPWNSLPERVRSGRFSVEDAEYALLVGKSFSARYRGREAWVRAALEKLLGPELGRRADLVAAAERIYDGEEAPFLGEPARGQVGLVQALVGSREARRYRLRRALRAARGVEPTAEELDGALPLLERDPGAFFEVLVEQVAR